MKIALVTGAGSGIGRSIAVVLGNAGYALALAGRRRAPLEETAELIEGSPGVLIVEADVSTFEGASRAVEAAVNGFDDSSEEPGVSVVQGLDVLVNNAGAAEVVGLGSMTAQHWDLMLAANASTAGYTTIAAWRWLVARRGCVVNVSSMAAVDPLEGFAAYGAAKGAVSVLTAACAKEGAASGVSAFAICPGAVETAMLRSAFPETVLPRSATLRPETVAGAVLACVRGERAANNGKSVVVLPRAFASMWENWKASHPTGFFELDAVFG